MRIALVARGGGLFKLLAATRGNATRPREYSDFQRSEARLTRNHEKGQWLYLLGGSGKATGFSNNIVNRPLDITKIQCDLRHSMTSVRSTGGS